MRMTYTCNKRKGMGSCSSAVNFKIVLGQRTAGEQERMRDSNQRNKEHENILVVQVVLLVGRLALVPGHTGTFSSFLAQAIEVDGCRHVITSFAVYGSAQ